MLVKYRISQANTAIFDTGGYLKEMNDAVSVLIRYLTQSTYSLLLCFEFNRYQETEV